MKCKDVTIKHLMRETQVIAASSSESSMKTLYGVDSITLFSTPILKDAEAELKKRLRIVQGVIAMREQSERT